jgi:lipoate-protein ligase A
MRRSVRKAYRTTARALTTAFASLGIDAALAESVIGGSGDDGGPALHDCFAIAAPNDIVDRATGRKICGCALRRTKAAVLLQASIPVSLPLRPANEVVVGGVRIVPVAVDASLFAEALRTALADKNLLATED